MEKFIREGTLRLQIAESSCDVILNCQGHRLMAHKLILSIASPVFRDLLRNDSSEASVVILPDITRNTMSLILDYIYTGSVIIYSTVLAEFLSVARLLKIHLDLSNIDQSKKNTNSLIASNNITKKYCTMESQKINYSEEIKENDAGSSSDPEIYSKPNKKRIPNLIPISKIQKKRLHTKLCNYVIPSPWCPRIDRPVLEDPRNEYLGATDSPIHSPPGNKLDENDTNNNFQFSPLRSLPGYLPTKLNDVIKNLYLNSSKNSTLGKDSTELPQHHKNSSLKCRTSNTFENKTPEKSEKIRRSVSPEYLKPFRKRLHKETFTKPDNVSQINVSAQLDDKKIIVEDKSIVSTAKLNDITGNLSGNDSADSIIDDVKNEQKQKPFKCEECGKHFSQLRNYKYHRSLHEGTKEFSAKCTECGKVFNDKGYLSSHMKIHRDRKEYGCPHCPKRFNQRVAFNMHLRIHTGLKPHECPTCGKSFSRKMLLKQHQRVHTGERPYACPECGKTFADRSNMSLHARLHTGVKPYACNLCPKSFTKKHHLKTHMNFHTGLKPYSCEKCGLAFSQSSNMRTHYKKCVLKDTTGEISSTENPIS